jgi:hypothetical protein
MRTRKFIMAALIAMPIAALAQNDSPATPAQATLQEGQTSSSCISNIVFSQEFLARYPNAGAACTQVKMEGGKKWARFDADVARVKGNRITANFVDRSDRSVGTVTFDAAPDAEIDVNGSTKKFSDLQKGDKLSFWMPEDRVGFYAKPGAASETSKLAVVSTGPPQR